MISRQMFLAVPALVATVMAASAADMPVKAPRIVEQPQQVMGYVEIYGGWARTKQDFDCDPLCNTERANGWALGGAGRATWWWAPNYSLQLDAQGEGNSYRFNFGNNNVVRTSSHNYLIGGHANWRDPGRGLIGIFGGAGDATNALNFASIRHGLIGAEAQVYWGPITLYGQGGYDSTLGTLNSFGFDSIAAWFVRGTGRYYVTPNLRLEGTVLYADGQADFTANNGAPNIDYNTWLWRAKVEYKFAGSPFSLFALYEGSQTKTKQNFGGFTETQKFTEDKVLAGVRLYINENTLQFNDRNGTTLDIIAPHGVGSFTTPTRGGLN
jgi:hypothetical protein